MQLNELHSFNISDALYFHKDLNPAIFDGDRMNDEVREQLLVIANDFIEHLGINDLDVQDITISGSNAAYSYTKYSDIDLHIIVDLNKFADDDIYRELFDAKKTVYNEQHDITINGYEVELYVQDVNQPHISLGEYSVMHDKWNRLPRKRRANFDQTATKLKYEKLIRLAEFAIKSNSFPKIENVWRTIKKYRQAGLDLNGEFGPENLAFKALRNNGVIDKLKRKLDDMHSKRLSLPESTISKNVKKDSLADRLANEFHKFKTDEDYDPNGVPPGPEFKPTMPAGTVRVDVSDVYDWYKLGKNISNLDQVDPNIFGKGPPSTIMAFGSEEEEHKYINALKKLGLTTTDIDPLDPNQPKNMPRQTVDPAYNVNEVVSSDFFNRPEDEPYIPPTKPVRMGDYMFDARSFSGSRGDFDAQGLQIRAYDPKNLKRSIGSVDFIMHSDKKGNTWLESDDTEVDGLYQGKGIATMMYAFAKSLGNDIKDSPYKSMAGANMWSKWGKDAEHLMKEASGYIPSDAEKDDPRFKTALTVDVKPDTIKKNASAFGFKVSRAGIPPLLRK